MGNSLFTQLSLSAWLSKTSLWEVLLLLPPAMSTKTIVGVGRQVVQVPTQNKSWEWRPNQTGWVCRHEETKLRIMPTWVRKLGIRRTKVNNAWLELLGVGMVLTGRVQATMDGQVGYVACLKAILSQAARKVKTWGR